MCVCVDGGRKIKYANSVKSHEHTQGNYDTRIYRGIGISYYMCCVRLGVCFHGSTVIIHDNHITSRQRTYAVC